MLLSIAWLCSSSDFTSQDLGQYFYAYGLSLACNKDEQFDYKMDQRERSWYCGQRSGKKVITQVLFISFLCQLLLRHVG